MNQVAKVEDKPAVETGTELAAASPMAMMIQAKQAGFTTEEIKDMMDLQDRNDARLAKQAFYQAMANFKRNPPRVYKDRNNDQFGSTYVSIGNMVNTVNEALGPHGLNARWNFETSEDKGMLICTCILSHEKGHEEKVTLDGPIDTSGSKNALQGRKSARTYLKLETFEAVTGMASEEGNCDDDANAVSAIEYIDEGQVNQIHAMITDNDLNMDIFLGWLANTAAKAGRLEDIPVDYFDKVIAKISATIKANQKKPERDEQEAK